MFPARARRVVCVGDPTLLTGSSLRGLEPANQSQETREHIPGAGANGACGGSSWPTNQRGRESISPGREPMEPVGA
eukprot:408095-Prorocentrum_minimum.AAC.1